MDNKKSDSEQDMDVGARAKNVEMHGLFTKAKRAPTGLFKSLIERKKFEGVNLMLALRAPSMEGAMDDQKGVVSFLCDSNLWCSLAAAYGRCDCMVEGKFKKARVFAFETENLYIWCASETGHGGTEWFVSDRSELAQKSASNDHEFARWDGADEWKLGEWKGFMKSLIVGAALAHEATMAKYAPSVAWVRDAKRELAAMVEASELRASALPAPARGRKVGL